MQGGCFRNSVLIQPGYFREDWKTKKSGSRGTRTPSPLQGGCFRNSVLIQPGYFREDWKTKKSGSRGTRTPNPSQGLCLANRFLILPVYFLIASLIQLKIIGSQTGVLPASVITISTRYFDTFPARMRRFCDRYSLSSRSLMMISAFLKLLRRAVRRSCTCLSLSKKVKDERDFSSHQSFIKN